MKKLTLLLILATQLVGCLDEVVTGCPAEMTLSFSLQDQHQSGDFDTRVGNDVLLYVFKGNKCVAKQLIPYSQIKTGGEYHILKTDEISGQLDMVAWSVPATGGDPSLLPQWTVNQSFSSEIFALKPTRATEYFPHVGELYLGVAAKVDEPIDQPTNHKINMIYSTCRVKVNVHDPARVLSALGFTPAIELHGTMSKMDVNLKGSGEAAIVRYELANPSGNKVDLTTGQFGVLPSAEGQTISVDLTDGVNIIATLTIPRDNLPVGAKAGGYIEFDYTIGEAEFWVTINGFRVKIENVEGI